MMGLWRRWRDPFAALERRRLGMLARHGDDPMLCSLLTPQLPTPAADPWALPMLVLDMETSGLDPARDRILSLGWVPIIDGRLRLGESCHHYLSTGRVGAASAVIHHITPQALQGGVDERDALRLLLKAMTGRLLVAHGSAIERRFLGALLARHHRIGEALPLIWLDTLALERSLLCNRQLVLGDYRLSEIRKHRGLPPYLAHNALADAVATGELLLVQMKEILAGQPKVLAPLYRRVRRHCNGL
ncbi:exonuclease domain-containing protein [Aeromonas media]|uniref:3'-5' exonuclease n=1 Tax=Aeromonas media TaxID=651 RepID=UPI00148B297A|nr:3'-5' exonuclease [Aeromonas media]QJT24976.1 3'-5' exonuclease [Aeromonas media]